MTPYFYPADHQTLRCRRSSLEAEAISWEGTPFIAHSQVKRAGVDCVHLAGALYVATGALKSFSFPAYSLDGGRHNASSQVLIWLDQHPNFQKILDLRELMPGDLLCFRSVLSVHHVGVFLAEGKLIHARHRYGVQITSLQNPEFTHALMAAYRPMENA